MPNPQTQPHKNLLKTWTGWEQGIGYLPEDDDSDTRGLYFADGVLGIRGELRPGAYFNESSLYSHIMRRVYNVDRQGAVLW